jgi:hypothetical protein
MDLEKLDFSKIGLVNEKKGYRFFYNLASPSSLRFNLPLCTAPFGIENYNKKELLNLNIPNENNELNNLLVYLRNLEKVYEQFSNKQINKTNLPFVNLPINFIKDVNNLEFSTTIKPGHKNGILLRTHLTKSTRYFKISTQENKETKIECSREDFKNKKISVILELSYIWIYGKKYGFLWNIIEINFLF